MNNINVQKDYLYLLKDEINDGILHATDSLDAAAAMSLFSPRITLVPVETHKHWLKDNLKNADYRNKEIHLKWEIKNSQRSVVEFSPEQVTAEYINYRKEIATRTVFHEKLVMLCNLVLAAHGVETPMLERYSQSIIYELSKCSVDDGNFSPAVKNYATIAGIRPQDAYQELKLHIDSLAQTQLRNLALYVGFRNEMNNTPVTELPQMYANAISTIYKNAQI